MNDFVEVLQSIGGVKLCDMLMCKNGHLPNASDATVQHLGGDVCPRCHGTGIILDLAPLLAKPKELGNVVGELCHKFRKAVCFWKNLHVVGPQRASNLVYEVARQLGGTAVMAVEMEQPTTVIEYDSTPECNKGHKELRIVYRLSLPIPLDSTVLFVTDRVDDSGEMLNIMEERSKATVLPYVLCLIAKDDVTGLHNRDQVLKIISLHQEKPCPGN